MLYFKVKNEFAIGTINWGPTVQLCTYGIMHLLGSHLLVLYIYQEKVPKVLMVKYKTRRIDKSL